MHLTLKTEATKPAAANTLKQQVRFDAFHERFNHERPHQVLCMTVPAELYARSARPYIGLAPLAYPLHDWTGTVMFGDPNVAGLWVEDTLHERVHLATALLTHAYSERGNPLLWPTEPGQRHTTQAKRQQRQARRFGNGNGA